MIQDGLNSLFGGSEPDDLDMWLGFGQDQWWKDWDDATGGSQQKGMFTALSHDFGTDFGTEEQGTELENLLLDYMNQKFDVIEEQFGISAEQIFSKENLEALQAEGKQIDIHLGDVQDLISGENGVQGLLDAFDKEVMDLYGGTIAKELAKTDRFQKISAQLGMSAEEIAKFEAGLASSEDIEAINQRIQEIQESFAQIRPQLFPDINASNIAGLFASAVGDAVQQIESGGNADFGAIGRAVSESLQDSMRNSVMNMSMNRVSQAFEQMYNPFMDQVISTLTTGAGIEDLQTAFAQIQQIDVSGVSAGITEVFTALQTGQNIDWADFERRYGDEFSTLFESASDPISAAAEPIDKAAEGIEGAALSLEDAAANLNEAASAMGGASAEPARKTLMSASEGLWRVPEKEMLALIHKDEIVVPAHEADYVRTYLKSRGRSFDEGYNYNFSGSGAFGGGLSYKGTGNGQKQQDKGFDWGAAYAEDKKQLREYMKSVTERRYQLELDDLDDISRIRKEMNDQFASERHELLAIRGVEEDSAEYKELVAVQTEELNRALAEAEKKLKETSDAAKLDIETRKLIAQGRDEEAEAMRLEAEQAREVSDLRAQLLQQGMPEEDVNAMIADLQDVQAMETARIEQQKAWAAEYEETEGKIRKLRATGDSKAAEDMAFRLAQEKEYNEAIAAGATAEELAELATMQAIEATARKAELERQERERLEDLSLQIASLNPATKKAAEWQSMLTKHSRSLAQAQRDGASAAEINAIAQKNLAERQQWIAQQVDSLADQYSGLESRYLKAIGRDDLADAFDLVTKHQQEYNKAVADGASDAYLARLKTVQEAEVQAWLNEQQRKNLEEAKENAEGLAEVYKGLAESLKETQRSLMMGDLSTLSKEKKLSALGSEWDTTLKKAQLGDKDAMSELSELAQEYADAAREYFGSTEGYAEIYNKIQSGLGDTADTAGRIGKKKSDEAKALDRQIELLTVITDDLPRQGDLQASLDWAQNKRQEIVDLAEDEISEITTLTNTVVTQSEKEISAIRAVEGEVTDLYNLSDTHFRSQAALPGAIDDFSDAVNLFTSRLEGGSPDDDGDVPQYASGGFHSGGPFIAGENGAEFVVGGPARIWNKGDTTDILAGALGLSKEGVSTQKGTNSRLEKLITVMQVGLTKLLELEEDQARNLSELSADAQLHAAKPKERAA